MRRPFMKAALAGAAALAVLTACSTDDSLDDAGRRRPSDKESASSEEWFVQADFDKQDQQRSATFEGDPETARGCSTSTAR